MELLSFVNDTFGLIGNVKIGFSVGKFLIDNEARKKRDELVKVIESGKLSPSDFETEDFISSVYQVHLAIVKGVGIANIRLLSNILLGLHKSETLYADQFLRYATILQDLNIDELKILALFIDNYHELGRETLQSQDLGFIVPKDENAFQKITRICVEEEKICSYIGFLGYCAACTRTGLLISATPYGTVSYHPTPHLKRLHELIQTDIRSYI